jgi:hypothetical protein
MAGPWFYVVVTTVYVVAITVLCTTQARPAPWCQSLQEARAAGTGYPRYRVRHGQRCWYTHRRQLAARKPPAVEAPPPPLPPPLPPDRLEQRSRTIEASLQDRLTYTWDELADLVTAPPQKATVIPQKTTPPPRSLVPVLVAGVACAGALLVVFGSSGHVRAALRRRAIRRRYAASHR